MAGAGALSHAYIQYPPFRCNIPGSLGMIYDDGNKLLLVPSPGKVFSWPMSRNAPPDSPSITSVDDGPVLGARFSLDGKLLAIQRSEAEISFFNREKGLKFSQLCRSRTDRILGFFWSDCPTCNIVYVTNSGLELYSLASGGDALNLVDVKASNVSWYRYTHESRLVLLASGVQSKSFLGYQFSAGGIIKLPKFDASMRKGEGNQKLSLGPEDVHIATMYGRLYCLQVDKTAMELNIYRFYRDAVVPQGVLPIYSEKISCSVVDNVLLVHQVTSKVVLLYDIFTDMKFPISAPLPLLLRGPSVYSSHENSVGSLNGDDIMSLTPSESDIYTENWVFANPDIILDHAHGILWRVYLDLAAITASSSDIPSLLAFLQRRRIDNLKAKELSVTVLRSIIVEKRPLSLISDAMDVINIAFAESVKVRALSSGKSMSSRSLKPTLKEKVETAPAESSVVSSSTPSSTTEDTIRNSNNVGKNVTEVGSVGNTNTADDDGSKQAGDEIVEETRRLSIGDGAESSHSATRTFLTDSTTLSPDEVYQHIFMVIEEEMAVEPSFLSGAIIQYMQSAAAEKLKIPPGLDALLVQLLARDERYAELAQFVDSKIVAPSREVAMELLQAGKSCQLISKLGLNMLRQLSAHGEYLLVLLEKGRLLEGLRYARQNRVEAIPPSTFLELGAATNNSQTLASILRFCLDFVPGFEQTSEYGTYSAILKQHNPMVEA